MNTTPRFEVSTFFGPQVQEMPWYPLGQANPLNAYRRPQYYEQAKKAVGHIMFTWYKSPLVDKIRHAEYAMLTALWAYRQAMDAYNTCSMTDNTRCRGIIITDLFGVAQPVAFTDDILVMREALSTKEWRSQMTLEQAYEHTITVYSAKQLINLVRRA